MTRVLAAPLHPSSPPFPVGADREPDLVLSPSPGDLEPLAHALVWAQRERGDWLWVLGAGLEAGPATLAELLAAADVAEKPPALVASVVLGPDGVVLVDDMPRCAVWGAAAVLEGFRRRLVVLAFAHATSLLVRVPALAEVAPPRDRELGGLATAEWSARLFRRGPGLMAPHSVVRRIAARPPDPALATLRGAFALRQAGLYSRGHLASALLTFARA